VIPESVYRDLTPIAHGYTVASAARIAYTGAQAASRWPGVDQEERHAVALCAVVAELRTADGDPGTLRLIRAAQSAVTRECNRDMSSRGRNANPWKYNRTHQAGYARYAVSGAATPLDEFVTDSIACRQILATLTSRQREVLCALAACDGDPKTASLLVGVQPTTVSAILRNVRDAFVPLWHEHETPQATNWCRGRTSTYSPAAAAARHEIAQRSAQTRKQRRALAKTEATP